MEHEITVSQKPNYLHIKLTGKNNPLSIAGYIEEMIQISKQHNSSMLLIEGNLRGLSLNFLDIYHIVSDTIRKRLDPIRTVAYVNGNPNRSAQNSKFAETVASNRGLMLKIFTNIAEAESWLEEIIQTGQILT